MISCREALDFLDRHVNRELSTEERASFDGHLGVCPPCVAYLRSYELTIELGKRAHVGDAQGDPPEELLRAILDARRAQTGRS